MSSQSKLHSQENDLPLVWEEMRNLSEHPMGGDQRVGAFALAMSELIETDPVVEAVIFEVVQSRLSDKVLLEEDKPAQAHYLGRLIFSATQKHMLSDSGDPKYPYDEQFRTPKHWKKQIQNMLYPDSLSRETFKYDVINRDLMSNLGQRYATLKLIMRAHGERWDSPKVLDLGCSLMIGDLMLLSPHPSIDFKPVEVYDEPQRSDEKNKPNPELTKQIGSIVTGKYCVAEKCEHTGVDIFERIDAETLAWAISNSRYPQEIIKDSSYEYDIRSLLSHAMSPELRQRVRYLQADFTQEVSDTFDDKKFDVIFASTMLYQHTVYEQKRILRNMIDLASEDGLVIIQDGAERDPNSDWFKFSAQNFSDKYRYKTYVLDMADKDRGFQQFVTWANGRCEEMAFFNSRFTLETIEKLRHSS